MTNANTDIEPIGAVMDEAMSCVLLLILLLLLLILDDRRDDVAVAVEAADADTVEAVVTRSDTMVVGGIALSLEGRELNLLMVGNEVRGWSWNEETTLLPS